MNCRYLLTIAIIFTASISSAQVEIKVLKDDPENISSYRLRIPIIGAQASLTNTAAYVANFGLEAQVNDKLYFSSIGNFFLYEKLFPETLDGSKSPKGNYVSSQIEDQFSRYFQIDGTYFFNKTFEQKEMNFQLYQKDYIQYYATVPATVMVRNGLRLGYRQGFIWYHLRGGNFKSDVNFETEDQSTYLNYSQIRVGIAKAKTTNFHVDIKGYGKRHRATTHIFYADFIYAISHRLEDVYYYKPSSLGANGYTVYYTAHEIDEYTEKQKIGFEIGVRLLPLVERMGYHAQLGTITGVKGVLSAYFELGICFSLGTREKAS